VRKIGAKVKGLIAQRHRAQIKRADEKLSMVKEPYQSQTSNVRPDLKKHIETVER